MTAIPFELARQLCAEISAANQGKWYTFNGLWCRSCAHFGGDASRHCFARRPDNRGCAQVNARYARLLQIKHELQPNEF
jgi:hypothetical protein